MTDANLKGCEFGVTPEKDFGEVGYVSVGLLLGHNGKVVSLNPLVG